MTAALLFICLCVLPVAYAAAKRYRSPSRDFREDIGRALVYEYSPNARALASIKDGTLQVIESEDGVIVKVTASQEIEDMVMRAGFKSCFGCNHYGDEEACKGCTFLNSKWTPSARWRAAQKEDTECETTSPKK